MADLVELQQTNGHNHQFIPKFPHIKFNSLALQKDFKGTAFILPVTKAEYDYHGVPTLAGNHIQEVLFTISKR